MHCRATARFWRPTRSVAGLFEQAGHKIMELCERWYKDGDETALPRGIANFKAFENAMALDIAMGGSTNTVLHLLAIAHEGGVDFTMADMDRLSRQIPHLSKVAPSTPPKYHMEDVHRAGGIARIMGELDREGKIHRDCATVHEKTVGEFIDKWDMRRETAGNEARDLFIAAPGGVRTTEAFSQSRMYTELDLDVEDGCVRDFRRMPIPKRAGCACSSATSPSRAVS